MKSHSGISRFHVSRWVMVLAFVWTLVAGVSLIWNVVLLEEHANDEAKANATALFNQDLMYRRWNASHGGVYVPVSVHAVPNPYLSHIPDRDVTTTSGKKLTLMNPAYMTRQVHELLQKEVGRRGHITSLKPIRPEIKLMRGR